MADDSQARVYGMADQANRDPPPAQGMRGEKSSLRPQRPDPDLSHKVRLDNGRTVVIREGSGVAFAESSGRAGLANPKPWLEPAPYDARTELLSRLPLFIGLGLAAAVIGATAWRLRSEERRDWGRFPRDPEIEGGLGERQVGHQSPEVRPPA